MLAQADGDIDTDTKRDNIFDDQFCIERAMDGPWGNYDWIIKQDDYDFTDLTFPGER